MTDCSEVVVDIISGEELPLLAAGIGGTIAAIVGLALGIIIMKCFCMDVLKRKFNSGQKKTIELSSLEESKSMQVDHQIRNTTGTEMYQNDVLYRTGTGLSIENDLNLDEKYQHEIECHVNSKSVVDVLCGSSIEIMACKVFEQRSDDLQWILLNAWKVRHTCLLQVFRMVLDQYLRSDLINDVQFTNILSIVTKRFSLSLQKLQNSLLQIKLSVSENVWEKSGNHSPQQHSSTMVVEYWSTCVWFLDELHLYISRDECNDVKSGIDKSMSMIEIHLERLTEFQLKESTDIIHRNLKVGQTYYVNEQSTLELSRTRRDYYKSMTHRLSQLGRLSKHDSTTIWDEIKTKLDSALEEIKQGMCTAEDRLKLKYRDHWTQLLLKFEKRKSKLVKNLLDVKKAKTISAFIEGYIDLYLQLAEHQSHNIQDANNQEIVDLAEVQKKRRQLHTLKSKEAESYLWEMLQASGALSNEEITAAATELDAKIQKKEKEIAETNQTQNHILAQELAKLPSLQTTNTPESQNIHKHGMEMEKFLATQLYLTTEDKNEVFKLLKVNSKLFESSTHISQLQTLSLLDVRLVETLFKYLVFVRGNPGVHDNELASNIKKLRELHMQKYIPFYGLNGQENTQLLHNLVVENAAEKLVMNLGHELSVVVKQENQTHYLELAIIHKVVETGNLDSNVVCNLFERHRTEIHDLERRLRQEHDIDVKLLKERLDSERDFKMKKFKHTEEMTVLQHRERENTLSVGNILDKLLEQTRFGRIKETKQEEWEEEKSLQIYLQRSKFYERLRYEVEALNRKFLCELAVTSKVKRSVFMSCVRDAQECSFASKEETRKLISEFSRQWGTPSGKKAARLSGAKQHKLPPIRKRKKNFLNKVSDRAKIG